jgi:glc operon protein GlcG
MNARRLLVAAASVWLAVSTANAQVMNSVGISSEGAKKAIAAAAAEARRLNAPGGAIAVVDEGGNLVAVERLDGTFAAGANISIGKARTAALFKKPTKFFEDVINKGRTAMTALVDFTPLQGGVPIEVAGKIVGAIGVSGAASAQQDEDIAVAGAAAVKTMSAAVPAAIYMDKDNVAAAFAKGMPLHETDAYKVHASRRTEPGQAEIHLWETDVIYVLEGSATFVTGGEAVGPNTIAPGEIRGKEIKGGESRRLVKGDVVVVPKGVAHWFKEIHQSPFLYFVVKPISMGG